MMRRIVIKDSVSALMRARGAALQPASLHPHIARACERLFRDHIGALPPNRMGRSTGFWADAARATHAEPTDNGCVVSVNKLGFRQRYFGGEIHPVSAQYLTIPARTEFYGARAREFTNLRFVQFRSGAAALVVQTGGAEKITGLASTRAAGGKQSAGMVAFWLVRSVRQQPDPGVLPDDAKIAETALRAAAEALDRPGRGAR